MTYDILGGPKGTVKTVKAVGDVSGTIDSAAGYSNSVKRTTKEAQKDLNDFRTFVGFKEK